jgi:hypothetical protein
MFLDGIATDIIKPIIHERTSFFAFANALPLTREKS